MPTPIEYITIRAPDFATDPNINDLISQAELETGENYCSDDMRNKAIALLVMHWQALAERDSGNIGVSGAITSEKEGDLARSYGGSRRSNDRNGDLAQTRWGLELLRLQQSCFFLPRNRYV